MKYPYIPSHTISRQLVNSEIFQLHLKEIKELFGVCRSKIVRFLLEAMAMISSMAVMIEVSESTTAIMELQLMALILS